MRLEFNLVESQNVALNLARRDYMIDVDFISSILDEKISRKQVLAFLLMSEVFGSSGFIFSYDRGEVLNKFEQASLLCSAVYGGMPHFYRLAFRKVADELTYQDQIEI